MLTVTVRTQCERNRSKGDVGVTTGFRDYQRARTAKTITKQQALGGLAREIWVSSAASGFARSDCRCLSGQGSLWERPCRDRALSAPSEARRRLTRAKPQRLFALEAATSASRLPWTRREHWRAERICFLVASLPAWRSELGCLGVKGWGCRAWPPG